MTSPQLVQKSIPSVLDSISFRLNARLITGCALVYMLLPTLLFLQGWYQMYVSIPLSIALSYGVFCVIKSTPSRSICLSIFCAMKLLLALLLCCIWCDFIGIQGHVGQHADFIVRNAFFDTLVRCDWPVINAGKEYVVYYLSFWLPPALLAKLSSGFLEADTILYLWVLGGVMLSVCTLAIRWPNRVLSILLILIFLAPLTSIHDSARAAYHLQQITGLTQLPFWLHSYCLYVSGSNQLWCTFNHIVPTWLFLSLYASKIIPVRYMFFVSVFLVPQSPIAAVVILPFLCWKALSARQHVVAIIRSPFTWVGALTCLFIGLYFAQSYGTPVGTLWRNSSHSSTPMLYKSLTYLIEMLCMLIPVCLFFRKRYRRTLFFIFSIIIAVVCPVIFIGFEYNELILKSSGILFFFLAILFASKYSHATPFQKIIVIFFILATSFQLFADVLPGKLRSYSWDEKQMTLNKRLDWNGHLNNTQHHWHARLMGTVPETSTFLICQAGESASGVLKPFATGVRSDREQSYSPEASDQHD